MNRPNPLFLLEYFYEQGQKKRAIPQKRRAGKPPALLARPEPDRFCRDQRGGAAGALTLPPPAALVIVPAWGMPALVWVVPMALAPTRVRSTRDLVDTPTLVWVALTPKPACVPPQPQDAYPGPQPPPQP